MDVESSQACIIMARCIQPDFIIQRFYEEFINIKGCFVDLLAVFEVKTALNKIS